ncbi:hypothetical protein [Pyxidicoccus trucidator]|uniref:hypothetical protein n=1 Tax=Pyxidicoccus trucidator TaxID=2709662 RepID=UPI0013DA0BBB|nr:hypothetical protein [Pyxidicoccus trucidator]
MVTHPPHRAGVFATSALVLTLLALPTRASAQEVFTPREDIPDAHLRGVTHVVCVTFPEGAVPEVPVYERRALGFEPAGSVPRARTVPVSRWVDPGGSQEDCFPAFEHERLNHHGVSVRYAHVMLDVRSGRKAWLGEGGADSPTATWITIESLRTLEAFEDRGIEFRRLLREDSLLIVREEPRHDASPVELNFHDGDFSLGRRIGDYAEVLDFNSYTEKYYRRGWVRLVDARGTLLLWPANYPSHGC